MRGWNYTPHEILGPAAALFRMFLAPRMEIERDFRVQADAEIIVHDTLLTELLSGKRK